MLRLDTTRKNYLMTECLGGQNFYNKICLFDANFFEFEEFTIDSKLL